MKFEEMTSAALAKVKREETLVVLPIAAVEQHGPHMPTGTDKILCTAVAEELESRMPGEVLLLPTIWSGASAHHLRFGATLDTPLGTYEDVLEGIGKSLLDDHFCRILLLNGHGGNIDPMRLVLRKLQPEYPEALLGAACYWDVIDLPGSGILEGGHQFVGHACEFETSLMLHLRPELVDKEKLADAGELVPDKLDGAFLSRDMYQRTSEGYTGRPDLASAEKGARLMELVLGNLEGLVKNLLDQPLGTEYGEFVEQ
jgi:creatinine amidohydrolase